MPTVCVAPCQALWGIQRRGGGFLLAKIKRREASKDWVGQRFPEEKLGLDGWVRVGLAERVGENG